MTAFEPTRTAALAALKDFVPKAGKYASLRNYDLPGHPHVSALSPYIRHRILTEQEVLEAVLGRYALSTVEKFVQEVYWRTYWKGWLEMRPTVWTTYRTGVTAAQNRLATEAGLRQDWEAACRGETDIDAFNHWAQELVKTGYMHNHARMWFASIWVFTLRLPWELGADFFLRHLLDGDPASNTLGWRWVAGLQTPGKVYTARSSNISKYTEGRFGGIHGLAADPAPVEGLPNPPKSAPPESPSWTPGPETGLLVTEDDLSPRWLLDRGWTPKATAALISPARRSALMVSPLVTDFTEDATKDALSRLPAVTDAAPLTDVPQVVHWAKSQALTQVVTSYAPVGPVAEALAELKPHLARGGIDLIQPVRPFDQAAWPHATAGFFKFKAHIPSLVGRLKGLRAA